MNRHSLFFKLNILFVIALLATLVAGASIIMHIAKKDRFDMMVKSRLIANEYRMRPEVPTELLEELDLAIITGEQKQQVIAHAVSDPLAPPPPPQKKGGLHFPKYINLFIYDGHVYLHIIRSDMNLLIQDRRSEYDMFIVPALILVLIVLLLVVMYALLRSALLPLRELERDILLYGEGKLGEYPLSNRKDEISQVADVFYRTASKLRRLSDSRMLFIRNLFHELNTPVTKGKLLTELVDNEKAKGMLEAIFSRLAMLLRELGRIEQITSENYDIKKADIHIADLIDEAGDLLFLESPVETNVRDEMIRADFASMSIVFKNLIDNACKYGKEPQVLYHNRKLYFISRGEPLAGDFKNYLEPFSPSPGHRKEGMGLGLYIVAEVLALHQMEFDYIHEDGKNIFTIFLDRRVV